MTKTRVLVLQVNSQLMEAVQQKVALSQQLDQWQQDVQELLSENMTKKMAANRNRNHGNSNSNNNSRSGAESDSSQPEKRKSSRIMSFLKLGSA
jgi:coiled-coil domain-containing protein 64